MITQHSSNHPHVVLKSDLAGEFPLYLYWPKDQSTLLYSTSITELLSDARVPKPLKLSSEGLSFLLQSGVVPPPKTAYQDIYILGVGDRAKVSTVDGQIDIQFRHEFPFLNANRLQADEMQPDEDLVLQMLAEATISRIDKTKPSFLFHSAGKDSNSIALALAEAGWQDKVTLITHKSKGQADESEISAKIAKKLGFKHQILHEVDQLQVEHKNAINDYFVNAPFPCSDNVTLAYPLYACQLPEIKGANIIDGMGNDVFIGHIPSQLEYKRQKLSKYLKHSRSISKYFPSESLLHVTGRTRAECTGLAGLSFGDTKKILKKSKDVSKYWFIKDTNEDYLDFRSSIRGTVIDQEIFTRKVRNFSDSINGNVILPFTNQKVAEYFAKIPEVYLFNRSELKNKIMLREILKERIGLDSDALGKMGFEYDFIGLVESNIDYFKDIEISSHFVSAEMKGLIRRFSGSFSSERDRHIKRRMLYRLFLINSWLNLNKFL